MKTKLTNWLIDQQNAIDKIITSASENFYNTNNTNGNFQYDLQQCHIESYNLIKGKDLCYDRPNTAFAYSLWYHPRRINTFLSFFSDKIINSENKHIEIFDLGAGTGAIQWCVALIYLGLKQLGEIPPSITIVNIDTSPFMLSYNRDYLWPEFLKHYPEIDNNFQIQYEVNSWNNSDNLDTSNSIIAASYLFDASDNEIDIANDFKAIIAKYKPKTILLLTSNQAEKVKFLKNLEKEFKSLDYDSASISETDLIFKGQLAHINALRKKLSNQYNISQLNNETYWSDKSHFALILKKGQQELTFEDSTYQQNIQSLEIYCPPITVRKEVSLNEKQKKAAQNISRPVVIVGPAGCGKSIVITEKIKNIVEEAQYDPSLTILVTTFNKQLISKLSEWLLELLDKGKISIIYDDINKKESCHIKFEGSKLTNIRVLHFDMLPKELGRIKYKGLVNLNEHIALINSIIEEVKVANKITDDNKYANILNAEFLTEEYHRVIYGLEVGIKNSEEKYLNIIRKGRGNSPSLKKNSLRRKLVWQCLKKYANQMHKQNIQSFTLRRQYFLAELKKGNAHVSYDYILIDEFQDCTKADFEIFYHLVKDSNNITIAGDLAQSIHLGTVAGIPRDDKMSKREFFRLDGSYRLPVRISESIREISNIIVKRYKNDEGATYITPYKASPPGARPIVIFGENNNEIAEKVQSIFTQYQIYDLKKVTILEHNNDLWKAINNLGISVETDSILRLKGLEKECVLWSTSSNLDFEKEVLEFAYTIMTRTSSILIIIINNDTQTSYKSVLGMLNKERLIFWDTISESKFLSYCQDYTLENTEDEEDVEDTEDTEE